MSRRVAVARSPEGSSAYYVLSRLSRCFPPPPPSLSLSLPLSPSLSLSPPRVARRAAPALSRLARPLPPHATPRGLSSRGPVSPAPAGGIPKTWPARAGTRSSCQRGHRISAILAPVASAAASAIVGSPISRGIRARGKGAGEVADAGTEQNYRLRAQHHHKSQVYGRRRSYSRVR